MLVSYRRSILPVVTPWDVVGVEKFLLHDNPVYLDLCRVLLALTAFTKHQVRIPSQTVRLTEVATWSATVTIFITLSFEFAC